MSATARRVQSMHVPQGQREVIPVVDVCAGFSPHLIADAIARRGSANVCPITLDTLVDPVMIADGGVYEKNSISQWLRTHECAPCTNLPLQHKRLLRLEPLRAVFQMALCHEGRDSEFPNLEKATREAEMTQVPSQDCHEKLLSLRTALTATARTSAALQAAISRAGWAAHHLENRISTWAATCIKSNTCTFVARVRLEMLRQRAKQEEAVALVIQRRWREYRRRRALREKRRRKKKEKRVKAEEEAFLRLIKFAEAEEEACAEQLKRHWRFMLFRGEAEAKAEVEAKAKPMLRPSPKTSRCFRST